LLVSPHFGERWGRHWLDVAGYVDTIGFDDSAAGIPLGRQGKVDEIAATCLFLVSDDGGFITGQTIHVNGGAAYY